MPPGPVPEGGSLQFQSYSTQAMMKIVRIEFIVLSLASVARRRSRHMWNFILATAAAAARVPLPTPNSSFLPGFHSDRPTAMEILIGRRMLLLRENFKEGSYSVIVAPN